MHCSLRTLGCLIPHRRVSGCTGRWSVPHSMQNLLLTLPLRRVELHKDAHTCVNRCVFGMGWLISCSLRRIVRLCRLSMCVTPWHAKKLWGHLYGKQLLHARESAAPGSSIKSCESHVALLCPEQHLLRIQHMVLLCVWRSPPPPPGCYERLNRRTCTSCPTHTYGGLGPVPGDRTPQSRMYVVCVCFFIIGCL